MFYVASALLNERGLQFSKHGSVHAAFGKEFAKTGLLDTKFHRWLLDAFDQRVEGDYGMDASFESEDVTRLIAQAHEFLREARRFLDQPS
jgi:uncharacterized protein (UPF0332 family)